MSRRDFVYTYSIVVHRVVTSLCTTTLALFVFRHISCDFTPTKSPCPGKRDITVKFLRTNPAPLYTPWPNNIAATESFYTRATTSRVPLFRFSNTTRFRETRRIIFSSLGRVVRNTWVGFRAPVVFIT